MSDTFNPIDDLIIVRAIIEGPTGIIAAIHLALDTGATDTLISMDPLLAVGYDPTLAPNRVPVTTGSGIEYVPFFPILRLTALGQTRTNFDVLAHTLPPSAGIDGLLGLNFLRGQHLVLDFRAGQITLT